MRPPRFTIRALMLAVAVVGLAFGLHGSVRKEVKVYGDLIEISYWTDPISTAIALVSLVALIIIGRQAIARGFRVLAATLGCPLRSFLVGALLAIVLGVFGSYLLFNWLMPYWGIRF
jgi:hypothetical protein